MFIKKKMILCVFVKQSVLFVGSKLQLQFLSLCQNNVHIVVSAVRPSE